MQQLQNEKRLAVLPHKMHRKQDPERMLMRSNFCSQVGSKKSILHGINEIVINISKYWQSATITCSNVVIKINSKFEKPYTSQLVCNFILHKYYFSCLSIESSYTTGREYIILFASQPAPAILLFILGAV